MQHFNHNFQKFKKTVKFQKFPPLVHPFLRHIGRCSCWSHPERSSRRHLCCPRASSIHQDCLILSSKNNLHFTASCCCHLSLSRTTRCCLPSWTSSRYRPHTTLRARTLRAKHRQISSWNRQPNLKGCSNPNKLSPQIRH